MKIKDKYIGKFILKGNNRIELKEEMSERDLLFIKNNISPFFLEEENLVEIEVIVPEETIEKENKLPRKKRKKKDDIH
ncbi:MAG: hypothetical protein GY870_06600 [archaeon]|nr:hypothetical protein [archaeon]